MGEIKEMNKVEVLVTELKSLKNLSKRQKNGAILSVVIVILCMYGLYNMEFTVDVSNTNSLEAALEEYFFQDSVDPNIVEMQKIGRNLIVLFERGGYEGHYGIAHLEWGVFGKYRFTNANLSDWPLYNYSFNRDRSHLILYGINDLAEVKNYALYPSDDISKEPIYQGEAENSPFLRIIKLDRPEHYLEVEFIRYYDGNGDEIDCKQLWDQAPEPMAGRTPGVGSAELEMIYVYIGILLLFEIVFLKYFLRAENRS